MHILFRWLVNTAVILIVASLIPGIHVNNFLTALIVALVLGIINVTIKPLLTVLTLPITIITLGLFLFVINACMLLLTAALVPGFSITGFIPALLGSVVISLLNFIIHRLEKPAQE
jgi:putative membrane protein